MQSNFKEKIDFSKLNSLTLTILRKRKWQEREIAEMTADVIFREICCWYGVMKLDKELTRAKNIVAFKDICLRNGISCIDMTLFNTLSSLRKACVKYP